jgi:hypothetical protein
MPFLIQSSTEGLLPQEAMRSIVEAVDTWRGQAEAFVVFRNRSPFEIASVHATEADARTATRAGHGLSYFGPVAPRARPPSFGPVLKTTGCGLMQVPHQVASVVLRDADGAEVAQLTVNGGGAVPDPGSDIEAVFLTVSGLDKFMIPYLTKVFGADYAAAKRREWVKE